MKVLAPCKVNPWLEVLGRRADGYHELDTTLLALEPCDELVLDRTSSGRVEFELGGEHASADIPRDASNLAVRAAQAVLERARALGVAEETGLRVTLNKRVPSGAGLGGGSSDAAAAAWAARELLAPSLGDDEIETLLAALGSDTVFFWAARQTGYARARGRGERVEPRVFDQDCVFLLVTPEVVCPTASVYAQLRTANAPAEPRCAPDDGRALWLPGARFNRLEAAALSAVPELRELRAWLESTARGTFQLSGSGSSFYGVFESEQEACAMRTQLLDDAARHGLVLRGVWVSRPTGFGARLD